MKLVFVLYPLAKGSGILIGWLVVLMIYVTLAIFQPYRNMEVKDNQSLKS